MFLEQLLLKLGNGKLKHSSRKTIVTLSDRLYYQLLFVSEPVCSSSNPGHGDELPIASLGKPRFPVHENPK